ncbi:unnamed protein product [Tetraodon nigroviridis]|uniref:(spotted green pufferfish) hypothetical protein n=1 Tax=Tetraodon nigroviridis TaxID=99883 RepID=Q4SQD3_TETNG|nr:unnamed protein product [Tetraodon nigroviridis]
MSDPETFSSCSMISDPSDRPSSGQSVGAEKDPASALVSDLYIHEREIQDLILCPKVAQEEFEGPGCDSRVVTCACEHMAEHCFCHSRQGGVMLDRESDVSQSKTLIAHAGDACEAAGWINDAQQSGAEVMRLPPQMPCCDNSVELWLDACQYLAGEAPGDLLHESGVSVMQEVPGLTENLDFPTANTPVSGYSPDGPEGIGCSDDDTVGRGPPVERWSSVDSWASALSDWTGIITALPEDLTTAFTEIGAEIDALTQALAEVNAHLHKETSDEAKVEGPAGQSQPLMGVQDQPLKPQNLPDSSVLSGQGCLPRCLQDGDGSQSVRMLCDANTTTQRGKEREKIQSRRAELAPCHTHLSAPTLSPSDPVASTGGDVADVIPEFLDPADVDLRGYDGQDFLISNNKNQVILKIIEDTDLEKAHRELLKEEVRWLLIRF